MGEQGRLCDTRGPPKSLIRAGEREQRLEAVDGAAVCEGERLDLGGPRPESRGEGLEGGDVLRRVRREEAHRVRELVVFRRAGAVAEEEDPSREEDRRPGRVTRDRERL